MELTNKKLFLGRLGKEPDLRYTKNQKPVCTLSVATTNEEAQKTVWHRVIVWGKQAELCNLYLRKGKEVFVQGRIQLNEFTGSDGELIKINEINAELIGFSNL